MANAPNTGSTLGLDNGVNKTSTALSTNIIILVNNTPIGAVQTLSITETRSIQMIDEVGTDGHIDSTPNKSTDITGNCTRIRFDKLRIAEAFSRGFSHVHSQAYPFDIVILDKQKRATSQQISTVIKNVWIREISYDYSATDWIISDKMSFEAEAIYSILNGGNNPIAVGGERGIKHMGAGPGGVLNIQSGDNIVNVEQIADTGSRRGSLDAAGLIDIGDSGTLF
jgi:hypothetical protein